MHCYLTSCNRDVTYKHGDVYSCYDHKLDGMMSIEQKVNKQIYELVPHNPDVPTCPVRNCRNPCFCLHNGNWSKQCEEHYIPNILLEDYDIKPIYIDPKTKPNRYCRHEDCFTTATFNDPNNKTPLFCAKHKTTGMVDVRSKKCIYEGCNRQPIYNIPGEKAKFCGKHKTNEMEKVRYKKCAYNSMVASTSTITCTQSPIYNFPGDLPMFCEEHKTTGMINITIKKCQYDNCQRRVSRKPKDTGKYCKFHEIRILQPAEKKDNTNRVSKAPK